MAEQVMDVRSSAALVRQRWRTLATAGVVGIALGVLYVTLVPAQLGSAALILLPESNGSSGAVSTATQVRIILSTPVLEKAGASVTPALAGAEVKQRIDVDETTSQLIEIRAFSRRAPEAQALSQAVAEAYIATLRDNARSLAAGPLGQLRTREAALTGQLTDLQTEIDATTERQRGQNATPPDERRDAQLRAQLAAEQADISRRDAQLLAQLTAEQADISLQVDQVQKEIAALESPGGASQTPGIIQPASPATAPSLLRRLLVWTFTGALLAVAAAALVLLIRRLRDPRVRTRDDLADAVGSSVLGDVHSRPQRSVAGWLTFFERYEAPAVEAWTFRQVLRALVTHPDMRDPAQMGANRTPRQVEHPRSLTVLALSGDPRGVAIGPQLAVFAASLGIDTRFVVATGHDSAASLRYACATDRGSELRSGLVLKARTEGATPGRADLTIVLAVADRSEPTLREIPATVVTVLAISPGVGTKEELARLAVAADDTGRRIDGIVIADPDSSDRTTGRRTLDERALQSPLPVRMTGTSQMSRSTSGREKVR